jgi:hypothetical protein
LIAAARGSPGQRDTRATGTERGYGSSGARQVESENQAGASRDQYGSGSSPDRQRRRKTLCESGRFSRRAKAARWQRRTRNVMHTQCR